jgi:hypothetical protein
MVRMTNYSQNRKGSLLTVTRTGHIPDRQNPKACVEYQIFTTSPCYNDLVKLCKLAHNMVIWNAPNDTTAVVSLGNLTVSAVRNTTLLPWQDNDQLA